MDAPDNFRKSKSMSQMNMAKIAGSGALAAWVLTRRCRGAPCAGTKRPLFRGTWHRPSAANRRGVLPLVPGEPFVRCPNFGNDGQEHLSRLHAPWADDAEKIVAAGWDFLVHPVMRDGGYVRYDGRKSTQVLRDCEGLIAHYGGSLGRLHEAARDAPDLEQGLLTFLRHRAGDREHLSARAASLLEQGRSRSSASGEEVGEAPVRRSWTLSTEKPHFRSGGGRSDSAPA